MSKNDKVKITIELDKNLARELELLAKIYNTKSDILLSHLVSSPIIKEWAKIQQKEHPQNMEKMQVARYERKD